MTVVYAKRMGRFFTKKNNALNISSQQDLNQIDIERDEVIYIKKNRKYYASEAVIESISDLGGVYKIIKIFYLVPKRIRNFVYRIVSKNRKRFFL